MAYDASDRYLVLFGGELSEVISGVSHFGFLNDTWTYANGTWSNITATAGPPPSPRAYASLSDDGADNYLLLIGGACVAGTCSDLWSFHNGKWLSINPNWPPTLNPSQVVAAFDSTDGYEIVQTLDGYSGTTWKFQGGDWTDLTYNSSTNTTYPSGPGFYYPTMSDDPAAGGVVFFGGYDAGVAPDHPVGVVNATWLFSGGQWTNLTGSLSISPAARYFAGASYNPTDQGMLLYGGFQPLPTDSGTYNAGTWVFASGNWQNASSTPAPAPCQGPSIAWDGVDNASILFGGNAPLPSSNDIDYNSTWEWSAAPYMDGLSVLPTPDPVDNGTPVQFSAPFDGGVPPFSYAWSFGDGGSGSGPSVSHTFSAAGTYASRVTVNDSVGHSLTASATVNVVSSANASPSALPSPTDAGLMTHFQPGSSGGTGSGNFTWAFGDGSQSDAEAATHIYATPGLFTVWFWANDTGGAHVVSSFVLRVNLALGTPLINGTPSAPSLGQLVNFTATDSGGTPPYVYSWAFGDGTTGGNLQSISHIFTTNGPFTAGVKISDAAGASSVGFLNLTVALNLTVLADWTAGAAPLAVGFVSQVAGGHPGYTYMWQFGDGGTSTLADPSHSFTQPGSYQVEATVLDSSDRAAQAYWSVYVAPGGGPLSVSLGAAPRSISSGGVAIVTSAVSGGSGGYTYSWSNGSGGCAAQSILIDRCSEKSIGSFTVALSVTDSAGSTAMGQVTIDVFASPSGTNPNRSAGLLGLPAGWADWSLGIFSVAAVAAALIYLGRRTGTRKKLQVGNPAYRAAVREVRTRSQAQSASEPSRDTFTVQTGGDEVDKSMPELV